jgi:adenylate cyclase
LDQDSSHVLVVDDEDFHRSLILRLLAADGFSFVSEAINGKVALELIDDNPPDIILLDIEMPLIDGYEVLTTLKQSPKYRDIPVIIMSAIEELDSVVHCIELGAEEYLAKPVNATLMRARIKSSLQKKQFRDQEQLYLKQIEAEKKKVDDLLNVALPPAAVKELKDKGYVEPRRYENVAVLFCDVIQFTNHCDRLSPEEIIELLTRLFISFEKVVVEHGMEKIKTIGDEFMATAGLLESCKDPLVTAINCGLALSRATPIAIPGWQVRVGVNLGPVVAGVVGKHKYSFDVWGDTVNIASRMTSYGKPEVVTISHYICPSTSDKFNVRSLGYHDVKGKGKMEIIECSERT